jgi:murein DD-endopeptidase MepM/ murein hydrolase activator NlpD
VTETTSDTERVLLKTRLRERLNSISASSLWVLGVIGIPGELFSQLELLKIFNIFWLFMLWPFAAILIGSVKQALGYGGSEEGPRDWLHMGEMWRVLIAFFLNLPLTFLNPLTFRQDAMQLLGSVIAVFRYRGSLPDPETYTQSKNYRLPVDETWTVINGSPIKEYSHSWFPATQRYAYDFVITDEDGRSRLENTDTSIDNYYCYDQPVLAPADGIVVDVHDGDPELRRGGGFSHPLKRSITGNKVTIQHAEGEYSSFVHLVPGSITVEPGEHVERGEQVGRCGHSGNSSEPHLHFQLHDHPAFEFSAGLPVRFDEVNVDTPGLNVANATDWDEPDRGSSRYIHVGQRVTQMADSESEQSDDATTSFNEELNSELLNVRVFARVANGIAVGGFITVLAGFVVSSLLTIALGLAGLALLMTAHQVGNKLFKNDQIHRGSLGTDDGVGVAAALIGGAGVMNPLPGLSPAAYGAGIFVTGFVIYLAVREYERRVVLSNVS